MCASSLLFLISGRMSGCVSDIVCVRVCCNSGSSGSKEGL